MDGTLVDSGVMISNTINYVRKNIGLEEMDRKTILENVNNPNINPATFFYSTHHFTKEQHRLFDEYYRENCLKELRVYDGIKELLEELKENFKLSVATNASKIYAEKILNFLKLDNYFEMVIGGTCVERAKPHPDMILKTMEELNRKPEKTLLIGDSYKDIIAGERAKVKKSILVNWGFSDHKEAIESVEELKKVIYQE